MLVLSKDFEVSLSNTLSLSRSEKQGVSQKCEAFALPETIGLELHLMAWQSLPGEPGLPLRHPIKYYSLQPLRLAPLPVHS